VGGTAKPGSPTTHVKLLWRSPDRTRPSMNNNWWEIQISSDLALEELISWRLEQFGCQGTAIEHKPGETCGQIKTYLPVDGTNEADFAVLSERLQQDARSGEFSPLVVSWKIVFEEDWASSWKQYWHPQEIGSSLLIYPAWLSLPTKLDRRLLWLDPGMAFGTGTHETTQLCLESLENRFLEPPSNFVMADIGCGSGILAIAAIILGVDRVYAVDTDPIAISATQTNRDLNEIEGDRLVVRTGSIEILQEMIPAPVDGFVCNILAEVIIQLIPHFAAITKPTAWGSLSGIILQQVPSVTEVLESNGWQIINISYRQDWCCLDIRRQKPGYN
jgi:ribosomal protein L11 methyltransferase